MLHGQASQNLMSERHFLNVIIWMKLFENIRIETLGFDALLQVYNMVNRSISPKICLIASATWLLSVFSLAYQSHI